MSEEGAIRHGVRIEGVEAIDAPDNGNLREAFLREGLSLYRGAARVTNCGGRGRCGTCRVTVLEGMESLSRPTPLEQDCAKSDDPSRRLACQANVRGSVSIKRGW